MLDGQSKLTEALAYLRWQDLLRRIGRSENDFLAATVFDVLRTMYSEPHRKYHHLGHIVDCWNKSEDAKMSDCFFFSKHAWVEIDLASLGASPEAFYENRELIREEYKHLSNEEFRAGSKDFFTKMLERPYIFSTAYFRKKYEAQAIANIKRTLFKLKTGA